MSDNKRYYYLKLKDNFFDSDEMIVLESMPDGHLYSNILLKLYLRSLKNDGKLMFNERIPFNSTMLAQVTRHSVGNVEKAIQLFRELGLIEVLDNGAIYMLDIQNFIGKSSTEADRIRNYRAKIASEKDSVQTLEQKPYKCNDKSTPELEIELEIELDKDILSCKQDVIPFKEIVGYLNQQANTNFRASGADTKKHIKARWNDGFRLDDFKKVIDVKTKQWLNDPKMKGYLRPGTLFGPKFEGYLNECQEIRPQGNWREAEAMRTQRELAEIYGEQS
jgi:predicted phage replisome organizer/uncharacterized phage protein (TIGR02220 family)